MEPVSGIPTSAPLPDKPLWRRFLSRPSTRLGWWSLALGAVFVVLNILSAAVFWRMPENLSWRPLLIFYGIVMMLIGLAAGIVGLIAVIRRRERSWLVWLTTLLGLQVIVFLLGEFLVPH